MSSQRQFSSVLSKSKKIKKPATSSPEAAKQKKYKTFDLNIRRAIISSLRKTLIEEELVGLEANDIPSEEFLQLMDHIRLSDLNPILHDILKKYIPSFKPDIQNMRRWRRKIKQWMISNEKPEGRGHVFIPQEKIGQFMQHLVPELFKMPGRNFEALKQSVFKVLKRIGQPFTKKSCSKHWWYCFLDKNAEIRSIWEALPKRPRKYLLNKQISSDSDQESSTPIKEEERIKEEEEEEDKPIKIEMGVKEEYDCKENIKEEEIDEDFKECRVSISIFPYLTLGPLTFLAERRVENFMPWRDATLF